MSERRLNFNTPLMSVRRFSVASTTSSQENGKKPENARLFSNSDFTLDPVTEPVAVPFHWEQIPGQAKNDSKLESAKEINEDDDDYSDALDMLSPTDSFSLTNCSVSGLSGSDGLDSKPSGTFLTDPQTRDFMMSRFLPAAKAMALDRNSPLKKQLVPFEQARQVQKGAVDESRKTLLKPNVSSSNMIVPYDQIYKEEEEEEEEEESEDDFEYDDDSSNVLAKGCGIFPGLCLKRNSLNLLNTVPGLKISGKTRDIQKISYGSYKHKSEEGVVGSPKHRLEEAKKNKWIVESRRFTSPNRRSSPLRHSRGASPFRNNRAPQAPNGMHLLEFPSKVDNYKPNWLHHERTIQGVDSNINASIEKLLYIDAVNIAEKSSLSGGAKSELLEVSFPKGNESHEEIEYLQRDNQIVKFDGNSRKQNGAVPPPLLKSPSESWLGRMLTSKPMQSSLPQKKMPSTNSNTNWETIVKASYFHHDHIRYSEELTAHVTQHPET